MTSSCAGCVSRAKACAPGRAPGCFAGWAWDNRKQMSLMACRAPGVGRMVSGTWCLVAELLGYLAPHGVDDVSFPGSFLSCFLDYRVNNLPKIRYPGKIE